MESKPTYFTDTCTPMCIIALLTKAKLQNQPRCPSLDEWIKKMWYIYTMKYYSSIKKNEIMLFAGKWMEPEIMLSEISQIQTSMACFHMKKSRKQKT
jgi:hypothetical protein